MTETVAPQEGQLFLPPEWQARVLPRRGNGVRRPIELDPHAPTRVRTQIETHLPYLLRSLGNPDTDPDLAAAAFAHLDGEPNPAGAAAVSSLIRSAELYATTTAPRPGRGARTDRDSFATWALEFGTPFAVSAAIEELGCGVGSAPGTSKPEDRTDQVRSGKGSRSTWRLWERLQGPIALARGLVAEASAEEYPRIVASAADHRATPAHRMAAAHLLPDEADWVAQACDETSDGGAHGPGLPWTLIGDAEHLQRLGRRAIRPRHLTDRTVAELVSNLGVASMPVLAATLQYKSLKAPQRATLFEGIAILPLDEAMAFLVDRSGEPQALPAVRSAAARFPVRAARTTAARAASLSPLELARLTGVLRADQERFDAALAELDEDERAAIEPRTSLASLPAAGPERLPELLIAPPWANRRPSAATGPVRGLEPPAAITIVWDTGEHEYAMAIEPSYDQWDEHDYWNGISGQIYNQIGLSLADAFWGQLARNGADAADAVVERLRKKPKYGRALVPIRSPKAAALAVDWLARLKTGRTHAIAWLDRHGEHAAPLLIPIALGPGRRRDAGETALRHLADKIGSEAVLKAAEPYGPEATARVASLLAADPLEPLFGAEPRPGAWAAPDLLPPVLLRDRDAVLPRPAVSHLIAVLSLWSPSLPYRGADVVAEACDPESLTRFSHALFELWLSAGAPASDSWAVGQLARFGTDATVTLLEPMVAAWPGANQVDRAALGLEALAAIGTERAFNALYGISRMDKFPAVTLIARELAERVASRHGSEVEPLADRLVPEHGLTDPETLTLDYGPRRFHVRFDDLLRPHLADESGRTRARPPKPGARDDEATAKASIERFKRLTKDVERTAGEQTRRLRAAMLTGRTWPAADFRRLAEHPVTSSPVKRLVWCTGDGTGFRLSEDGGLTDVRERELELDEEATVRLAHPALLGDELPAWIELCNDYAVLQPFDQLSRPAMAFTAEEAATGRLRRFEGATATMGALRESMRWQIRYGSPQDVRTHYRGFERRVPGGWLLADVDPVPDSGDPDPAGRHRLFSVRLMTTRNRHPDHATPLPGSRLDPVLAAELLADLTAATGH